MGLAVFTASLAYSTWQLSRETRGSVDEAVRARKRSDRHHQESYAPLIVFAACELVPTSNAHRTAKGYYQAIKIERGLVRNIGTAPALSPCLFLEFETFKDIDGYLLPPLAPMERDGFDLAGQIIYVSIGSSDNQLMVPPPEGWKWKLKATYRTPFGTMRESEVGCDRNGMFERVGEITVMDRSELV